MTERRAPVRVAALALGMLLPACGGGNGSSPSEALGTCGVNARGSGGVDVSFAGESGCLSAHAFDTGLSVTFLDLQAKKSLSLGIVPVSEGQTGADFQSNVGLDLDATGEWRSDSCVTALDEHGLVKTEMSTLGELRHYQVRGSGTCSAPLAPVEPATGDPVTLEDFVFSFQVTWRD